MSSRVQDFQALQLSYFGHNETTTTSVCLVVCAVHRVHVRVPVRSVSAWCKELVGASVSRPSVPRVDNWVDSVLSCPVLSWVDILC